MKREIDYDWIEDYGEGSIYGVILLDDNETEESILTTEDLYGGYVYKYKGGDFSEMCENIEECKTLIKEEWQYCKDVQDTNNSLRYDI